MAAAAWVEDLPAVAVVVVGAVMSTVEAVVPGGTCTRAWEAVLVLVRVVTLGLNLALVMATPMAPPMAMIAAMEEASLEVQLLMAAVIRFPEQDCHIDCVIS